MRDYIIALSEKKEVSKRVCPICLKDLNKKHFLWENKKIDLNLITRYWDLPIIAIPCCLCRDILLDFIDTLENDKVIEISQNNDKVKIIFWCNRIEKTGYFKFPLEVLKRILCYGIIENDQIERFIKKEKK